MPWWRPEGIELRRLRAAFGEATPWNTVMMASVLVTIPMAIIYFVFVDRFENGDPSNDDPIGVPSASNWQGGDWAGVTAKIEEGYFTELGIDTLWLTVPMNNTSDDGLGTDGHLYSAYHGYCARCPRAPAPR